MRNFSQLGFLVGVFLTLVGFHASAAAPNSATPVFRSEAGRFSVSVSGTPKLQENQMETESGPVLVHLYVFSAGRQSRMVSYHDLASLPKNVDQVLDNARDGIVERVQGTLTTEKRISNGSFPGRELRVETKTGILMALRVYVAGNRVYQLVAGAYKQEFPEKEAAVYLNSFTMQP